MVEFISNMWPEKWGLRRSSINRGRKCSRNGVGRVSGETRIAIKTIMDAIEEQHPGYRQRLRSERSQDRSQRKADR